MLRRRVSFHQDIVSLFHMMLWIYQAVDERSVIGEKQQAFAVAVEPPGDVDAGDVNVLLQGWMPGALIGELGENTIGLVENDVSHVMICFSK